MTDQARRTADQAMDKAGDVAHKAQEQGKSQLQGQKNRAAEQLGSVADAVRATGEQLRDKDQANLAQYADMGAAQVERLSGYLREKDVNDLIGDAERLARRQPTMFLAGAFVLGIVGARFLKSSQRNADERTGWDGSDSPGMSTRRQSTATGTAEPSGYTAQTTPGVPGNSPSRRGALS